MANRSRRPYLITPGDPAGIGPEIVWKTVRKLGASKLSRETLICVGARKPFNELKARVIEVSEEQIRSGKLPPKGKLPAIYLLPAPTTAPKGLLLEGYQVGWSIEQATRLCLDGVGASIITGPISKERLQQGGFKYSGHTDFLADLCGVKEVTMMLANEQLRITLVTVHIGLHQVPKAVTPEKIQRAVTHTAEHLRRWWGIRRPRVAVAALNPHAGESGMFGDEETRVITPTLDKLRRSKTFKGCEILGPLPADTLFANHILSLAKKDRKSYDAVVCMYHDQGLIPVKLLDFPRTVNVTLGLPIVRTSVDHGVAFDIAGQGIADPSSFRSALDLAHEIVTKRG